MEEVLNRSDKKLRNISAVIIFVGILLIIISFLLYSDLKSFGAQLLLTIGIAILLSGLLIFTRVQYVIWILKQKDKKKLMD